MVTVWSGFRRRRRPIRWAALCSALAPVLVVLALAGRERAAGFGGEHVASHGAQGQPVHDEAVVVEQARKHGFVGRVVHPHRAVGGHQPAFLRARLGGRRAGQPQDAFLARYVGFEPWLVRVRWSS